MPYVPEDGTEFLHDPIYIDGPRINTLLADMLGGLPEKAEFVSEAIKRKEGSLSALGLRLGMSSQSGAKTGETRTLEPIRLSLFEEVAEPLGLLRDISEEASSLENWNESGVIRNLPLRTIVRITGPCQLTDERHMFEMFADLIHAGVLSTPGAKEFAKQVPAVMKIMANGVTVRMMPCGGNRPERCLLGILPSESEYIKDKQADLFNRYGSEPQEMTMIGIVTRHARTLSKPKPLPRAPLAQKGVVNREVLGEVVSHVAQQLEYSGLTQTVKKPGIAVVPIAIYQTIVAHGFDED